MAIKPDLDWFGRIAGKAAEADSRFSADKARREQAGSSANSVILSPKDLTGSYDAARMLQTTLGGSMREMTTDDLLAFQKNIETAKKSFKGGITPRQVIDLSVTKPMKYHGKEWAGKSDIDKAKKEIRHAIPISFHNGTMRIVTNASKDHGATKHHVTVKFLSYGAAASTGQDPRKMALWLRNQPIAFDCDCGRHIYWFRYITTIGGFNAGRPETGFPKIRNPQMHGVACKHVLRAMSEIDSAAALVMNLLQRAIGKAQANTDGSTRASAKTTNKDAQKQASSKGNGAIKTSAGKKSTAQAAKERKATQNAVKGILKPPKPSPTQRRIESGIKAGVFSKDQVAAMRIAGISDDLIAKMTRK